MERSYAINKDLARQYTRLKNLQSKNATLEKRNRKLKKEIVEAKKELNRISNRRTARLNQEKQNKNINAWLRAQQERQRKMRA